MRTLIVIPIAHTDQEIRVLLERVGQQHASGHEKWTGHLRSIDGLWSGVRSMIAALELPYANVRLYQDGLPQCGKEADIVKEIAARGSKNHQLLVELMGQGARLVGTEDPELLLQEYQLLRDALGGGKQDPRDRREEENRKLLAGRDRFIAGQINATLSPGEIGLLFLGPAHSVEPLLEQNILVRHLPNLHPTASSIMF